MSRNKERRLGDRTRNICPARLFDVKGFSFDVTIMDMSSSGARIELPIGVHIPRVFHVQIINSEFDRSAEVAWRRLNMVGIRFVDEAEASSTVAAIHSETKSKRLTLTDLRMMVRPDATQSR